MIDANANNIVKALLTAALELFEHKIIVRNIYPEVLMISADFKKVIFANTNLLVRFYEEDDRECHAPQPYNCIRYPGLRHLPTLDPHRDLWAIGMILMELLLGTEFFKFKTSYNWIKSLFEAVKPILDQPLQALLDFLCFCSVQANIECFISSVLEKQPDYILCQRRRIQVALYDDRNLGNLWNLVLAKKK